MTVKAIFTEFSIPFWFDVAEKLVQDEEWEICYWTGDSKFEKDVKQKFKNVIFHDNRNAVRGIPAPDLSDMPLPPLDVSILKELAYEESIALQMMNRMDPGHIFTYEERVRLYYRHLRYWMAVLDRIQPDVVMFPVPPHLIYDFVLYSLCKKKGIKTILFEATSLYNASFLYPLERFEEGSDQIVSMYASMLESDYNKIDIDKKLTDKAKNYLNISREDYSKAMPFYTKSNLKTNKRFYLLTKVYEMFLDDPLSFGKTSSKQLKKLVIPKNCYLKKKGKKIEDGYFRGWEYVYYLYKGNKISKKLKKYYENLTEEVDLTRPYVYVAFHQQPEATTSPRGEIFADQLLMVDLLSKTIPDDWIIYVKEHPMQFSNYRVGERSRIIEFYDDLASIPNVKMVPLSVQSFDLVDNSIAVATVTGTTGWQAVLRGKPALIFGHAWYKYCKSVFYVPTIEKCKEAISIISNGYDVDKHQIKLFVHVLEQICVQAWIDPSSEKVSGISIEENILTLSATISKFYKKLPNHNSSIHNIQKDLD